MSFAFINAAALHYSIAGAPEGAPLVLVNSLGTDLRIWEEVVALLAPRHRVLSYDKRGHGLSDVPAGPYSLDDHVSDLLALADHCRFQRFALCGISIGGMIAMRFSALHPQRVNSLVLADTGATIGTTSRWNDRIAKVRADGMPAIAEAVVDSWVTPNFRASSPAAYAGWRNMLERCPPEGYIASCVTVRDADLSDDLESIPAPTLVLVGDKDIVTPPALSQDLADGIPNARLRPVHDAAHVPAIEQPRALADLIQEHLNEAVHV
jgi:3-oxoadipate enol-lactonase